MDAGYTRTEAQGLLSDLEAGAVRQATARRIVSGDPARYGNSAAGLLRTRSLERRIAASRSR